MLGVSDAWTENFEGITAAPPSWYKSLIDSNRIEFYGMINSLIHSAAATVSSAPQSGSTRGGGGISGGGFSGGGFSGGGSGGGGGGRW